MDLNYLTAIIGLAITVASFLFGRKSAHTDAGREMGQIVAQLASMQQSLGRIEKASDRTEADVAQVKEQLAATAVRVEKAQAAADRANCRIDAIEGKV